MEQSNKPPREPSRMSLGRFLFTALGFFLVFCLGVLGIQWLWHGPALARSGAGAIITVYSDRVVITLNPIRE